MADLSSIKQFITKGKESQAEKIANKGGTTIYGSKGSGGSKSKNTLGISDTVDTSNVGQAVSALSQFFTPTAQQNLAGITSSLSKSFSSGKPIDITELKQYAGSNLTVPPPITTPDYSSELFGGMVGLGIGTETTPNTTTTTQTTPEQSRMDLLNQQIKALQENKAPDYAAEYAKAEKEAGILKQQQREADLTAQLNSINAKATADQLRLRQIAGNEGVTDVVYGAQQTRVAQDAAIAALPVQAELAAVQGKLEFAKERLTTLFNLKMKGAEMEYERKNKIIDLVFDYANNEQKIALEDRRNQEERAFTTQRDTISYVRGLSEQAMKDGNFKLASELGKLMSNPNVTDTDISRVIGSYGGGATQATELQRAQAESNISQVGELINSGGLSTAVGTNILSRAPRGFWGTVGKFGTIVGIPGLLKDAWKNMTGQQQNFTAGVEQLRSQLTLDKLIEAKKNGATFGSLTDGERTTLASAATKLGTWAVTDDKGRTIGYNAAEKDFRAELEKINNYAKLDAILKGSAPESVGALELPDGTLWVKNSDGTLTQLR